jgi:acylphosphatase
MRESVHGWVRNTPGGEVEIAVEGEADAVERFERGIRRGPPSARVDRVDVEAATPTNRETGFVIR